VDGWCLEGPPAATSSPIAGLIAEQGAAIQAIDLVQIRAGGSGCDYTIECPSTDHANDIIRAILFEEFGGDASPLCVATRDPGETVAFCTQIAPFLDARRTIGRQAIHTSRLTR
jgi:hypothetical protein